MQSHLPASQKILFISDVHLGAFSSEKNRQLEKELISLINFADENDFLIAVLGDLFDYWIEYPGFTPSLGKNLLDRFQKFNQRCGKSLYITGNHDNWTLGHFEKRGFDVEPDCRIVHINSAKILLLHGDAIGENLDSLKRPPVHRLLRNRTFLKIYRSLLPAKAGLWLMKHVSKWSNFLKRNPDDVSVLNEWAEYMLKQTDIDYIICGHDHQPRRLEFSFGTYLNLGTFYADKSLVTYTNGTLMLVKWNRNRLALTSLIPQEKTNEQLG